ncbi:hypothetical protein IPH25_02380 [bacterium]|nr:MAG: hypothetical protein IPG37_04520 [bacterium]QQR62269.1 MAG: hypothetical protein IPH25_02380 [bacterium]QQR63166.1 MAG: hypothetical protein IPH67_01685 [bacterium]
MHIKNSVLLIFLTVFATQCYEPSYAEIKETVNIATKFCYHTPNLETFFKLKASELGEEAFLKDKVKMIADCINFEFDKATEKELNSTQESWKNNLIYKQTTNGKRMIADDQKNCHLKKNMAKLAKNNPTNKGYYRQSRTWKEEFLRGQEDYKKSRPGLGWAWSVARALYRNRSFYDIGYMWAQKQANTKE